jgi:spermidine/putrescine transport system substrate-binding protein
VRRSLPAATLADSRRLSRRTVLRAGVATAASLSLPLLSACRHDVSSTSGVDWRRWWSRQQTAGVLDFANWPYYIDRRSDNSHPSLDVFANETGARVNYYRPIRDLATFLGRILPELLAGRPIGYDLIVITNGPELSQLINGNHLIPLDHDRLPSFTANASDLVTDPSWDPGNQYSVAWQSGLTGIAYRPEAVHALGREPRGLVDLWDRRLRGRVGMLSDLTDLGSFGLLADGVDPAASSISDWAEAAARLDEQKRSGVVRGYYDQGYIRALQRGDIWLTQAWSGDVFQSQQTGYGGLRFVVPQEGAMLWTDNLLIPRGAAHPADALSYMDFVYRPEIAAMIADWVQYITPVPAARTIIQQRYHDRAVANSPLVFPTLAPGAADVTGRLYAYPVFDTPLEERRWDELFGAVVA